MAIVRGRDGKFIWANLLHMGYNMWVDKPHDPKKRLGDGQEDFVRFDREAWNRVTGRMAEIGMNMIVIGLGGFMVLPSRPELAVKGGWRWPRARQSSSSWMPAYAVTASCCSSGRPSGRMRGGKAVPADRFFEMKKGKVK